MGDELSKSGQRIMGTLSKLVYEADERIESLLSRPKPKPAPPAEMADAQLRQAIFRVASDLIGRIGAPLIRSFGGNATDGPRLRNGLPNTVRMHVLMMFAPAHDSFAFATIGLQHSAIASALGPIRNVAETLAVTRWLLEEPNEKIRRGRGYALTIEDVRRQKNVSEHLIKTAPNPSDARTLATRLGACTKQVERDLRSLAAQESVSIPEKPDRKTLFEQYLSNTGGYAFFTLLSNVGAHPGPSRSSMFYGNPDTGIVDFDFQGRHDARAYWLAQGALLHLDLCRLVARVLDWQGWEAVGDAFDVRLEPLAKEAERRFIGPWRQAAQNRQIL